MTGSQHITACLFAILKVGVCARACMFIPYICVQFGRTTPWCNWILSMSWQYSKFVGWSKSLEEPWKLLWLWTHVSTQQ